MFIAIAIAHGRAESQLREDLRIAAANPEATRAATHKALGETAAKIAAAHPRQRRTAAAHPSVEQHKSDDITKCGCLNSKLHADLLEEQANWAPVAP